MSKDCTIQDVFHRFYPSFESTHSISPAQRKAAYHIMNCKTGAFGVNVSVCEDCGCMSVHYNSCRDRCCPMCQEFPKEKWVDARREDILDAPYFHVVFTVPEELNPIIYSNQKFLYTALYHAASDTLSELAADSKYLGTDIGYICILHTWGSTMNFHPHIHAIVLGGGLDVKNHWKDNGKDFFLPIKVISKIFRGKYMAELKQLWENDRLEFHGSAAPYKNYYTFNTCMAQTMKNHIRKPFFINYFLHLVTNIAAINRHSKSSRHYQVVIGILTAKRLLYLILFLLYINKALCHKSRYINFALTGIGLWCFQHPDRLIILPLGWEDQNDFPSCANPIPRFTHDTVLPTPSF